MERCRVAILDDDEGIRELLVELCASDGLDVVAAAQPDELPLAWRGDVILTDTFVATYQVDAIAGAVARLRARFDAAVVLVTGHIQARADATRIGADAVVSKPFDVAELLRIVTTLAGERRRARLPRAMRVNTRAGAAAIG